jgi:hypothetical protein
LASSLTVSIDSRAIDREARRLRVDAGNVRRATREGVNKTVYQARKRERQNILDVLDRPKPFTVASVAVELAKEGATIIEGRVYVMSRMEKVLERLEEGGILARGLGITSEGRRFENRWGSIGKRGVAKLLREDRVFKATLNHTYGVWIRTPTANRQNSRRPKGSGRQVRPVRLLLAFLPRADYDEQLGFVEVGEEVGKGLARNIQDQLKRRTRLS